MVDKVGSDSKAFHDSATIPALHSEASPPFSPSSALVHHSHGDDYGSRRRRHRCRPHLLLVLPAPLRQRLNDVLRHEALDVRLVAVRALLVAPETVLRFDVAVGYTPAVLHFCEIEEGLVERDGPKAGQEDLVTREDNMVSIIVSVAKDVDEILAASHPARNVFDPTGIVQHLTREGKGEGQYLWVEHTRPCHSRSCGPTSRRGGSDDWGRVAGDMCPRISLRRLGVIVSREGHWVLSRLPYLPWPSVSRGWPAFSC